MCTAILNLIFISVVFVCVEGVLPGHAVAKMFLVVVRVLLWCSE